MRLLIIVFLLIGLVYVVEVDAVGGGNIIYKSKHLGNVIFSHESHVASYTMACETCHDAIFSLKDTPEKKKAGVRLQKKKACGVCHNGRSAFDVRDNCYVCHSEPRR